jgi:HD-like signal output (HDOD) protein
MYRMVLQMNVSKEQDTEQHKIVTIQDWIQNLSDDKMPGFSGTVSEVTSAVNSEKTSAADVAQAILRDPSLTSRLLKMANSFYYNPSSQEISTVSRAVMVLGFDQVRALALSLVLIDNIVDGQQRDKLTDEIALSFHAAVQAEELARKTKTKAPENIFVATLLARLGNMAFWAFADDKANELLEQINSGTLSEKEAENQILGFSLKELTMELGKTWSLGELLEESLKDSSTDKRVNMIHMGQLVAEASINGWDSEQAQAAMKEVAVTLDMNINDVKEMTQKSAVDAKKVTKLYGITKASNRIPQPNKAEKNVENKLITPTIVTTKPSSASDETVEIIEPIKIDESLIEELAEINLEVDIHPEPDSEVQMTILGDISRAIEEKPSINIILEMVLEGLYRGVGMDRSLFAIISPDHKTLTCKYAVGADSERLIANLVMDISSPNNIFNQVVKTKKAMHVPSDPKMLSGTLTRHVIEQLGTPPYLVMPTIVKGKVIGVYMADRNASKRKINQQDFLSFQQFCQQANMGLTFLTTQG